MRVKILFSKTSKNKKLHTGWGISFLVDDKILFDTGENGARLLENMEILKVNIGKIDAVVISHDHWDHQGGLWELLKRKEGLLVYACPDFSAGFKERVNKLKGKLAENEKITEISKDIFVTGEIAGGYKGECMPEQALVVKTDNGISVITGCAHPGIVTMLGKIKSVFPEHRIYSIFGGFHLLDKDARIISEIADRFKEMAVEKAGPAHCIGDVAEEIFKEKYGINFIPIKAGEVLNI